MLLVEVVVAATEEDVDQGFGQRRLVEESRVTHVTLDERRTDEAA